MTTVVGATLFKAMCGSTLATCATFAGIAIPEMDAPGLQQEALHGRRRLRRHPGHADPPERSAHDLRDHHGTVHRQALSGRHHPGACSSPFSSFSSSTAGSRSTRPSPMRHRDPPGTRGSNLLLSSSGWGSSSSWSSAGSCRAGFHPPRPAVSGQQRS